MSAIQSSPSQWPMQPSQETVSGNRLRKRGTRVSAYAKSKFAVRKAHSCHMATTNLRAEKMTMLKATGRAERVAPPASELTTLHERSQQTPAGLANTVKMRLCGLTESPLIRKPPQPDPGVRPPHCAFHLQRASAQRFHRGRAAWPPSARGSIATTLHARRVRRCS